jgi:hypothetical protein
MKRAVLVVVAIALSALPVLPAEAGTHWRHCGSQHHIGAGWYHVRSHRVSCEDARTVARRWWNHAGPRHVTVDGVTYRCRDKQTGYETSRVRCRAPSRRRVRFEAGS